jgi:hypothetical protein
MMLGGYNYIPETKNLLRHINLDVLCIYNLYYTYRYLASKICFFKFNLAHSELCTVTVTAVSVVHVAKLCEGLYRYGYSVIIRTVVCKWETVRGALQIWI